MAANDIWNTIEKRNSSVKYDRTRPSGAKLINTTDVCRYNCSRHPLLRVSGVVPGGVLDPADQEKQPGDGGQQRMAQGGWWREKDRNH